MNEEIVIFCFFILIDLILLLGIIKLYVNTEVVKVKLLRNRTSKYTNAHDNSVTVNKQWEGYTKDGELVSGWYAINKYKKLELKEEGTYRNIIYDKKEKIFIATPFKRILIDIAFMIFVLPTFLGEVTDEILIKVIGFLLLLISAVTYGSFRIKPSINKVTINAKKEI